MKLTKVLLVFALLFGLSVFPITTELRGGPGVNLVENRNPSLKPTVQFSMEETSSSSQKKIAVLVGINDYQGEQNDLRYCVNDVLDMKKALVQKYGFSEGDIQTLTDGNATYANVTSSLDWLKKESAGDSIVVFYFSGHGSRSSSDRDGDGEKIDECIVTSDLGFLWDGVLASKFKEIEASQIWLGFDSCYSGGMVDADQDLGLKGNGKLNTMACKANQLSGESSSVENGFFTYLLVDQGILSGKGDADNDGSVSIEEAFNYAQANIKRYTRPQTPVISDGILGDFIP
ncbi:MAG: caspase family protein [Caldiserica bacterium]|nr:caspase family protein [Caldisericota bacterium]MDH7562324.1 caspase family protein [Caldisericota bacterium]